MFWGGFQQFLNEYDIIYIVVIFFKLLTDSICNFSEHMTEIKLFFIFLLGILVNQGLGEDNNDFYGSPVRHIKSM